MNILALEFGGKIFQNKILLLSLNALNLDAIENVLYKLYNVTRSSTIQYIQVVQCNT